MKKAGWVLNCARTRTASTDTRRENRPRRAPPGYWKSPQNQRLFLDKLANELRIQKQEELFSITSERIASEGGTGLLRHHGDSLYQLFRTAYPEFYWRPWHFEGKQFPLKHWSDPKNQRERFEMIAFELDIEIQQDWYNIHANSILDKGGGVVLQKYDNCLYKTLEHIYPEFSWRPWQFEVTKKFWDDMDNHRKFIDWVAEELDIQTQHEWYSVPIRQILELGGRSLMHYHEYSFLKALNSAYPQFDWYFWLSNTQINSLALKHNQQKYLDWLAYELHIEKQADFYRLRKGIIRQHNGAVLLQHHGSILNMLKELLPQYDWYPWLFVSCDQKFWTKKNQMIYIEWLREELQISTPDDWYDVTVEDVRERGGTYLLSQHNDSIIQVLAHLYPNENWYPWKYRHLAPEIMHAIYRAKPQFDQLAQRIGIEKPEDWYNVAQSDLRTIGARELEQIITGNSTLPLSRVLEILYPGNVWYPWLFPRISSGFWKNHYNVMQYVKWLEEQLGIQKPEDWYKVARFEIESLGRTLLLREQGLRRVLQTCYPDFPWKFPPNFCSTEDGSKSQSLMQRSISELFSGHEMKVNYRHPALQYSSTHQAMELDVFIPELSLAFEYQGKHHYYYTRAIPNYDALLQRDNEKLHACKAAGITLITVPYWWDYTTQSLQATIHQHRPDLIEAGDGEPIPDFAAGPSPYAHLESSIQMHHPMDYDETSSTQSTWIATEQQKCGITVHWDGSTFKLMNGSTIFPPPSFLNMLPQATLVGELVINEY